MYNDDRSFEQIIRDHRPITRKSSESAFRSIDPFMDHSFQSSFSDYDGLNMERSIPMKIVASRSSSFVVSISSYQAGEMVFACSGFIVECTAIGDKFHCMILTSGVIATNCGNDLRIHVCLSNSITCEGEVVASNLHYNLSLLKIECDTPLSVATLRFIGDSFEVSSREPIMVLGQHFMPPYEFMVAAGVLSTRSCRMDCEELLRAGCRISKCGIGGPVINNSGEVIGITFYASSFTPVLPINIAAKWWHHVKENRVNRQPHLGIKVSDLYNADLYFLEKSAMKFPTICDGIIVTKVKEGSVADLAGIQPKDVIVGCSGQNIYSSLQFLDLIWDRVGESIDISLIRPDTCFSFDLSIIVDELDEANLNSWPLPKERKAFKIDYPPR